ncbi:hypothetical protein M408DRAFT_152071 [Serendipita vermifera MAFF 305830]|uniref:Uncharacterized protein n=1 Tax=Serendipita vermifera MAFF 305830 TaxID=933852 RepID=A0A0C3BPA0_SERVB|nr:hypothetical protein M408DRAFT_152071 [Serendipita vermifera MAFF 305830]
MSRPAHGATSHLLIHIVIRASVCRSLRSFSVTEDFEPGGHPINFAQMDFDTRTAVEKTWREIDDADRANFDPVNSIFSLTKTRKLAGASGWENYVLIFQCTKAKFIPSDPRAALILCYLAQNFNTQEITMRHQFMIAPNCELGAMQGTYDWLEGDWRTAAKRELAKCARFTVLIDH